MRAQYFLVPFLKSGDNYLSYHKGISRATGCSGQGVRLRVVETVAGPLEYTTHWYCCPGLPVGMSASEALCLKVYFNPCTCW